MQCLGFMIIIIDLKDPYVTIFLGPAGKIFKWRLTHTVSTEWDSVRLLLTKNPARSFTFPWCQVHGISFERCPRPYGSGKENFPPKSDLLENVTSVQCRRQYSNSLPVPNIVTTPIMHALLSRKCLFSGWTTLLASINKEMTKFSKL